MTAPDDALVTEARQHLTTAPTWLLSGGWGESAYKLIYDLADALETATDRGYQRGHSAGYGEAMREWQTSR